MAAKTSQIYIAMLPPISIGANAVVGLAVVVAVVVVVVVVGPYILYLWLEFAFHAPIIDICIKLFSSCMFLF
jgi:hypothetical protein